MQEAGAKVDCVITSPPYWGLRDYGVDGQIGLEKHPQEYIDKIVKVFSEVRKVLKDTGSLWLNLGDSYCSHRDWTYSDMKGKHNYAEGQKFNPKFKEAWLQPKQKMLMPHRVAIAMQDDDGSDIYEIKEGFINSNRHTIYDNNALQRQRESKGIQSKVCNKMESQTQRAIQEENGRMEEKESREDKTIQSEILLGKQGKGNNALHERECQATQKIKTIGFTDLWWESSKVFVLWRKQDSVFDYRPYKWRRQQTQETNKEIWEYLRMVEEREIPEGFPSLVHELQFSKGILWFLSSSRGGNIRIGKGDIPKEFLEYFKLVKKGDSWLLRNDVVWHKPSHMPSSVRDRLTNSFEFLFHFVKQKKYYYDLEVIREPYTKPMDRWGGEKFNMPKETIAQSNTYSVQYRERNMRPNPNGKNPGDMWSINPKPYPDAHFACFPPALVEKPLKATCPREVCVECGKPRERIIEKEPSNWKEKSDKCKTEVTDFFNKKGSGGNPGGNWKRTKEEIVGWSDCGCKKGFEAGVVLDPFVGSGTTLLVAQEQNKNGVGIEINPDYIKLIKKRLNGSENQSSLNPNKIEVF